MPYKLLYVVLGHWKTVPVSSVNILRGHEKITPPDRTNCCLRVVVRFTVLFVGEALSRRLITHPKVIYISRQHCLLFLSNTKHSLTAEDRPVNQSLLNRRRYESNAVPLHSW
uniref:FHA domain-containing protein n=1 Tax=Sipha flava TaxID=143950 RepID=A0A2S2QHH1_9HEMI